MATLDKALGLARPVARLWYAAILLSLCCDFTLDYISLHPLYPLDIYAAGRADVPFRIFPILVMRAFGRVGFFTRLVTHLPIELRSTDKLAVAFLAFFGMLAAAWCTGRTLRALGVARELARWVALLVIILSFFDLTPAWGLNYTLPYDVPAVAFFCAGVWLIVTGQMLWFYPLFAVATLNRETSCFLIVFYCIWKVTRNSANRRTMIAHMVALSGLWAVVKLVPAHLYAGHPFSANSKASMFHDLIYNLHVLIKPQQLAVLLGVCGFTLPLVWLGRGWIRNRAFSYATAITLACWFFVALFQGVLVEIRIFAEWAALIVPCLGLMIYHRLQDGAVHQSEP